MSPKGGLERTDSFPRGYSIIEETQVYKNLRHKLFVNGKIPKSELPYGEKSSETLVIRGFEDVLDGNFLGVGRFHNTFGSSRQLISALAVSKNAEIEKIASTGGLSGAKMVKRLREKQVLTGMRIADLGAGGSYFARTAKALGATVVTVDVRSYAAYADLFTQIEIDLTNQEAGKNILASAGEKFDFVTENIVGRLPGQTEIQSPKKEHILAIAKDILKREGYLYSLIVNGSDNQILKRN